MWRWEFWQQSATHLFGMRGHKNPAFPQSICSIGKMICRSRPDVMASIWVRILTLLPQNSCPPR